MARRHRHGRHHLRRRHAPRRHRTGRHQGRRRQLAVVELRDERHAHRVLLRAAVAPRAGDDRRRARRAALQRRARRLPARVPRPLPGAPHQPHHPRLGHPRDDQDPHHRPGPPGRLDRGRHGERRGPRGGHLLPHHPALLGGGRDVGRPLDRPRPVHHQDVRRHHPRRLRRGRGGRHRRHEGEAGRALRQRGGGALGAAGAPGRGRAVRLCVDAPDDAHGLPLRAVVGRLVSRRRAGRRRLRGPAHLQRPLGAGRRARHPLLPDRPLRAPALAVDRDRAWPP